MMSLRSLTLGPLPRLRVRTLIPFTPAIAYLLLTHWPGASLMAGSWLTGDFHGGMLVFALVIGRLWLWLVLPTWLASQLYTSLNADPAPIETGVEAGG